MVLVLMVWKKITTFLDGNHESESETLTHLTGSEQLTATVDKVVYFMSRGTSCENQTSVCH